MKISLTLFEEQFRFFSLGCGGKAIGNTAEPKKSLVWVMLNGLRSIKTLALAEVQKLDKLLGTKALPKFRGGSNSL